MRRVSSPEGLVQPILFDAEQFVRDGCAVVDFLAPADVEALRDAYRRLARPHRTGFDSTIMSHETEYREAVDAAVRTRVTPRVASLLNGYRVAFCTFAVKDAGSGESAVPIHQDWSFVDERRFSSIGVWCPLVDVALENGCLQIVKGSHAFPHPPRAACTPFAYPELVPYLERECLEPVPMTAGQAMLFDQRLFHCSPPNRTSAARVAATAVLVPHDAALRYYHVVDSREPSRIEVFEVNDRFYLHHVPGRRPEGTVSLGVIDLKGSSSERTAEDVLPR
jgi:ectoine hydroxylase-related dioxygenase (phytanoyl-CoA dioxygenase family)